MTPLYYEDKKVVHQQGLWHKVVTGVVFNKTVKSLYFQTIYPKDSYTFDRPDYIDFSIGGHVEDDESVSNAILRETKEEFGLVIDNPIFLGVRVCSCDPALTYHIREFQHFYGIETTQTLMDMNFLHSDKEVKSFIEVKIDDFLDILLHKKTSISVNEMILDEQSRSGTYIENTTLNADRIIPEYYIDKSILEMILAVKTLCE